MNFNKKYCVLFLINFLFIFGQNKNPISNKLIDDIYSLIRSDKYLEAYQKNDSLMVFAIKEKDTSLIANCYSMGGIIYSAMGNFNEAKKKMTQSLLLYKKIKNPEKILVTRANLYRLQRYLNKNSNQDSILVNIIKELKLLKSHKYIKIKYEYASYQFRDKEFSKLLINSQEFLQELNSFHFSKEDESYRIDYFENLRPLCLLYKSYSLIETGHYNGANAILNSIEVKKYLNRKTNIDELSKEKEKGDYYFYKTKYFLHQNSNSDSILINLNKYNTYNTLFYTNFQDKFRTTTTDFIENDNKIKMLSIENNRNRTLAEKSKLISVITLICILFLLLIIFILYRSYIFKKRTNIILEEKNLRLISIDEERNRFFSIVTHELRTPIYSVKGLTHLLLEEATLYDKKTNDYLNSLNTLGEILYSMTNNLLLYAKFNLGENNIRRNEIVLRQFITKTIQPFSLNNNIVIEIDDEVCDYIVMDSIKLSQLLINLVSNALKFSGKNPVLLLVKNISQNEETCRIRFIVKDCGNGISHEKQQLIFNAFNKNEDDVIDVTGTGLGLYIVKNILKLYHSKIEIYSEIGKGSEFSFELNLEKYIKPKEENKFSIEGLRILVVDDNKLNLMITKKIIQKANATCKTAENGLDAIELVKNTVFDLILMDIHMPIIDGIETSKRIRKFNTTIPIIALTAVDFETNQQSILEAGMNDIVSKPFNNNLLFEKIYFYCT